jgi:hypothetical protein
MSHEKSQEPKVCGCGCGCLLSTDHLRGIIYVKVEGKPVLVNMSCYIAAYGEDADILNLPTKENNHV